ncbi:MAG: phosphotransferase [Acidobacteriota bacterium]
METVVKAFAILGDFVDAVPYGTGHINDTYAVTMDQGGRRVRYLFQRINHRVFRDPPSLMENICRVTGHIRAKLEAAGTPDVSRRTLTVIPTRQGASFWRDAEGGYWRAYIFIEQARTWDTLQHAGQAYQAARAFGRFQKMLADLPPPPLHETIPDFHHGPKRYQAFERALAEDVRNRAIQARAEIEFLQRHAWIFDVLPREVAAGRIPVRTTHNDTKINNVMMDDQTGEGICVIDLDTLMPGLALYDFGDMVRTSTTRAAEDERDLSRVTLELDMYEQLVRGYLSEAAEFLTPAERDHLVTAGEMITLIIGCRFLTDFLAGDTYFKIRREDHNLDRCRTQFRLVQCMLEQEDRLRELVVRAAAEAASPSA